MQVKIVRHGLKASQVLLGCCIMMALCPQAQAKDPDAPSFGVLAHAPGALGLAPAPAPAAKGWDKLTSHGRLAPMVLLLGTGSSCVLMTYDTNGNRMTQAVTTISSTGAVWGATSFGCFIWH
jgi:hypothetical protein